ncbi:ROK family protein [Clostridium botulinum]|uniref:Glucokinase n=1 Tax=Clostridium botulinum (strain Eklund 17B / Type B) TaxID=935198 RepID=B2TR15_CLOBB|nr:MULTISPECIES: ROK family protein [Clostridium]ACD22098.1 putative glucokinase [Clostridium botulinum B str. Eklund 17B (NRP)]AIY81215.1 ROK family protein [Clostridium botulinum 202F]KAI3347366.1 ROK family protein [Clostridium botulinum]KFX59839.1 glucokinase [Clostridium botulinum]KON14128.1 glucokinase [Clostridium botulinum]
MQKFVVGVDLGGTKISTALSNLNGEVISQTTVPTNAHEGEIPVLNRIIDSVDKVIKDGGVTYKDIKAIGIGSPGPLDAEKGVIIYTPNLPFKNFNLVDPLNKKFEVPVFLDNDANVATIGEFMFGAGRGAKNVLFFTVSTGVGGGAILDGKIYRGHTSNALEIGHMTVAPDGPRCNCGNIGCVEATSSGTAIGKRGKEAIGSKVETSLRKYDDITSYEVFVEAAAGDPVCKDIIDNALNYLGIAVANAVSIFDPEVIIIGGGVSKAGNIVFDTVRKVVDKRCFKSMAESVKIVPAGLGTDAGVVGAVALALLETSEK